MYDNPTPRERLAKIVAEETGGGRRIVRFLVQVADNELHAEGFKPCHRMDAAKELVKIGLTEFDDYVRANSAPPKPRARRTSPPDADLSPEIAEAREELAAYARELTQDGRTVIRMYAEVMDGLRSDEGFKPHHRVAAARELLKRGFDYECAHERTADAGAVTPKACLEPTTEGPELKIDNSELKFDDEREEYLRSEENMANLLEIVKRFADQVTPEEREAEEAAWRGKDLSMWDIIEAQPPPVITKEQARIGAAKFREEMARWRASEESDFEIPDPPEGLTRYDYG